MVYIERSITPYVQKAEKNFKAVLITGARQAGKSTLLKKLFPSRKYITFDDPFIEEQAIQNAGMFMTLNQPPVTFDEVQRIPDLFRYIKIECDKRDEYGLYCLSGSQPFRLMQNVSESLSGRISIIELAGLSLREIQGDTFDQPFLPSMDYVMERQKTARQPENIWQIIHRGSFPELYQNPELDWQQFYASYIKTYLERDVRELSAVQNLDVFRRFMVAVAARTGQMVNYANIADEVGRDAATIRNWFSILEASGIIYLQSLGKALASTVISMIREVVFGVGFALLLPILFGLDGVLYSMPVSDALTFVIAAFVIRQTMRELSE